MKNFLKLKRLCFNKICLSKELKAPKFLFYREILRFFFLVFNHNFFFYNYIAFYISCKFYIYKTSFLNFFFYFILNFVRLQEFFSFVFSNFVLFRAFSAGFLLKIFSIFLKKSRRNIQKHRPVLLFLKKFFLQKLGANSEVWLYGFKKKYLPVVFEVSTWGTIKEFVWCLRKSTGAYRFRRVVAIKKRIRKNINKRKQ